MLFVREQYKHAKSICAFGDGVALLESAGIHGGDPAAAQALGVIVGNAASAQNGTEAAFATAIPTADSLIAPTWTRCRLKVRDLTSSCELQTSPVVGAVLAVPSKRDRALVRLARCRSRRRSCVSVLVFGNVRLEGDFKIGETLEPPSVRLRPSL